MHVRDKKLQGMGSSLMRWGSSYCNFKFWP